MEPDRLNALVDKNVKYMSDGFSLDISAEPEIWSDILSELGHRAACRAVALLLRAQYEARFNQPFLFSEACVANELLFHVRGYFAALDIAGWSMPLLCRLLSKATVRVHCQTIEISTADVYSVKQRLCFGYRRGVCREFRGTDRDPYRSGHPPLRRLTPIPKK